MKRAHTDATGFNRNNLNAQEGNDQDVRQGSDAGKSQPTQHAIPTVSVNNDRPTSALTALLIPPQAELASQFASSAPPVQLSASQPVLRGLEAAESAHGSGNGQTNAPGSLVLHEPCLTWEQGSDPGTVQAALDKPYRNDLSAWVESAAPSKRAVHQEVERTINAYLELPFEQRKSIRLLHLGLSTLPPLPAGLIVLDVGDNELTALPENLPQGLRVLRVSRNRLTALPENLPQGLWFLEMTNNRLTALPENLPQGLLELWVGFNKLTALPENLPQGLRVLWGPANKFTVLPKHLPQGLHFLEMTNNRLTALPEHLPPGLQLIYVGMNKLTALPENLPQGSLELQVGDNQLTALPEHLPQGSLELQVGDNQLTALPEHLPQGLQKLMVGYNELTVLPKHLPLNLKNLTVSDTRLNAKTLVALMRISTSITELEVDSLDIDAGARQALEAELVNNREHPARLLKAAATLDLLTRFSLTTSDQSDTLIKRGPTPEPVAGRLPEQPIPADLHHVLAANCPKDVLAMLAGMVDGTAR